MTGAGFQQLRGRLLTWLILVRELPGYLRFLPLVARAALGGRAAPGAPLDVPGNLTAAERDWLAAQARRTPDGSIILQADAPQADVTCALALGCRGSRRRVHVSWPPGEAAFRQWHRTIIRQGLAPYVTPEASAPGREAAAWRPTGDPGCGDDIRGGPVVVIRLLGQGPAARSDSID